MTLSITNGRAALLEQVDAAVASFLQSCVHCGLCADACLFYTETGDPKYTPIRKVEPLKRLWKQEYTLAGKVAGLLGLSKPVTDEELAEWEELVYDSCTLCGRCSMVCPVGNDITYMIRKMREGMSASGHMPQGLRTASIKAVEQISPIGIGLKALNKQIEVQSKETGIAIEMDKKGADYMVLLSSMEIIGFPEIIGALAKIFKQAGKTWTVSSKAYEGTNVGIQLGNKDIARKIVQRTVDAAEDLGVKYVVSPECGHAYQAIRWEGPNLIGRPYKFEVVQLTQLLDDFVKSGKIRTNGGKYAKRITYHDPCQLSRRGGMHGPARNLLGLVAGDYVETYDAGEWNWCCGGGGGVSANHRAEELRLKVFTAKKRQLDSVKPEELVTSCANCRNVLEEAIDHYEMDLPVIGLAELLAEFIDVDPDPPAPGKEEERNASAEGDKS